MISEKMRTALNAQINAELWSAYLYLSMSLDAELQGRQGTANWMFIQWREEQDHARILEKYMMQHDAQIQLLPIAAVPIHWNDMEDMFTSALMHETEITAMIHELVNLARAEQDYASDRFLDWFVGEQTEEEASVRLVLDSLRFLAGNPYGLFAYDLSLLEREYCPSVASVD